MLIEDAKEKIKQLENYIETVENYSPETMEQEAVFLYVLLESVTKVTAELNKRGYRIGNRKLNTVDVSSIIKSKPGDKIHEMAKRRFTRNKKAVAGKWF